MVEFQENNTEVRKNLTKPNFFNNLIEFSKKSRATHQASIQRKSPSDITAERALLYGVTNFFFVKRLVTRKLKMSTLLFHLLL